MDESQLLENAAAHAAPLIDADPLLASLAESACRDFAATIQLSGDTATNVLDPARALIQRYVERLAADWRISNESPAQANPQALANFQRISGLASEECLFLTQTQMKRWEDSI